MRKRVIAAAVAAAAAGGIAVALVWSRRSARRWERAERIVQELREGCHTPVTRLWEVADAMASEMRAGLSSDGGSSLRMLVTPLESLPTGNEEGLFYGLEINQTTIRMLCVQLGGMDARVIKKHLAEVPVPSNLMVGTSEDLYDFIAAELSKFISAEELSYNIQDRRPKEIGVTFSFPVIQNLASNGTIIEWTNGFSIKETGEKDAAAEINKALEKHGVDMHVSFLVNDTVGAFGGARYCSSDTMAAVTLGMGTNAAYMEPLHAIPKWQGPHPMQGVMIINMEWGNFQSSHFPITEFDVQIDAESPKPGGKVFEKLISGMYLGDIVRRVLLKMAEETALFGDTVPLKLRIPFVLRTPDVASMHQDLSQDLSLVGEKLEECLGIPNTTVRMRQLVVEVCDIVAKRGARLAGAAIVGILKKLKRDGTDKKSVVMVEGALYEHYRLFRAYLHDGVKMMLHGRNLDNVIIEHSGDGCVIGAALLAASKSGHATNS
ncbi:hexokinase-2-like [Phoenix dactylifera]|uniref:Phosphotransferase n=1 Tax=Phoenix dactylifera TaxID=42345 RepID=A0A8B7MTI2_PHODC|nr:hexokinase-2-like [Phoenix dactylifera]